MKQGEEGVYLNAIGRRDRYVLVPMTSRTEENQQKLWVGDLLSNGTENVWVIRYDFMRGIYCSLIGVLNSFNSLDFLIEKGLIKIGDIFDGLAMHQEGNHKLEMIFNPELFL